MTKKELINAIAASSDNPGVGKTNIAWMLEKLTKVVYEELAVHDDNEVTIPGLVKISAEQRAARLGRHPGTGERIQIPAKRVPKIKPLQALKDAVA